MRSHLVSCSTFKRQHTADLVSPELCTCWPARWLLWKSKDNHQLLPFCLTGSTDLHLRSAAAVHAACSGTLRTLTEDANTWKFWVVLGQTHTSRSLWGKKKQLQSSPNIPHQIRSTQPSPYFLWQEFVPLWNRDCRQPNNPCNKLTTGTSSERMPSLVLGLTTG